MPADPQRDRLYLWEDGWSDWSVNTRSLTECRAAVYSACEHFHVSPPVVRRHNVRSLSYSEPVELNVISFQGVGSGRRGGLNIPTALHEAAHHIAWHLWPRAADHGPSFTGLYLYLLEWGKVAPRSALEASARAYGLRWQRPAPASA